MPRAASLRRTGISNARAAGRPTSPLRHPGSGGVDLPNLPGFNGPPAGTFDPGLEAEVRSAERGLMDLIEKTRLEGHRESQDVRQARALLARKVSQGRADIARQRGYSAQDAGQAQGQLQTNFARNLQDLATAKQNGEEDYQRKLTEIQHSYATQAAVQSQASVAQGTAESGTTAASDAVRAANQTWDKQGVDVLHQRSVDALNLSEQRDREDFATKSGLINQGLGRDVAGFDTSGRRLGAEALTQRHQLHLGHLRAVQDRGTALSHARREEGIYSTDVAQQAYYQAHQLNPHILFPIPSAAASLHPHPVPSPQAAAPHVHAPAPRHTGLSPAISYPRRPRIRY